MSDINAKEWAQWLKDTRRKSGLSIAEIAHGTGVSRATLSRIEKEGTKLSPSVSQNTIKRVSEFLSGLSEPNNKSASNIDTREKHIINQNQGEQIKPSGDLSYIFTNLVMRDPNKAPEVVGFLQSLTDSISGDKYFKVLASRYWDQVRFQMSQLAIGRATINPNPVIDFVTVAIECAENNILATSMVSPQTWWFTEEGQMYHQANITKATKDKVKIQRIFFVNNDQPESKPGLFEIMDEQVLAEITVFKHDNSKLPEWITRQDVMIIDDKFAVIIEVNKSGQYKPALVSVFKADVDNAKRQFEFLLKGSELYK